jgi:DNA primase
MFSSQQISEAKNKSIVGYLKTQNIEPVNLIGGELIYLSPLRSESTPSFYVNSKKNDFGGSEEMRGDSIRLVQQLKKCSFIDAVNILLETENSNSLSFSFSGSSMKLNDNNKIKVKSVLKLQNPALIRYVSNREILLNNAYNYLSEVHYELEGKNYFAVGFKNDSEGFELRNGLGFKGKTDNGITTFQNNTQSVNLFEGSFDFLSALRHYKRDKPTVTTIILNTTNNLKLALPLLFNCKVINCYLDNDSAGEKVVLKLLKAGFNLKDWSKIIYPKSKDFNDYLVNSRNNKG